MNRRLVVCFRWHDIETEASRYLAAAERVWKRCVHVGGESISWSADRYAFDFDPEQFRLVIQTVLDLLSEASTHAVGIAQRELSVDGEFRFWGPALVIAESLARAANPGELLLDPTIPEVEAGQLATLGAIPVRVARERLSAALLLPGSCPADGFRESAPPPLDERVDLEQVWAPPPISGAAELAGEGRAGANAFESGSLSDTGGLDGVAPALEPPKGLRPVANRSQRVEAGNWDSDSPGESPSLSSIAPPKPSPRPRDVRSQDVNAAESSSQRPGPVSSSSRSRRKRPSMVDALRSGDAETMLQVADQLRAEMGQSALATRLEALASLAQGDIDVGLDALAEAAQAAKLRPLADPCRDLLAYAVGLAASGRNTEALLQAMDSLARAREISDDRGEQASVRLIAQLADAAGEPTVARHWLTLSQRLSPSL